MIFLITVVDEVRYFVFLIYLPRKNKLTIMAEPIADTPVIRGKDALRFMQAMANVKPISKKRRAEMERNYQLVKSRATFPL